MPEAVRRLAPIFILGILPRSGTNFLSDLLRLHPDCAAPAPIWEDFLTYHADFLANYAKMTCRHWRRWVDEREFADRLCQHLGDGLLAFLSSQAPGKRLVTKTPSVCNLGYFFKLFPQANLLIIVRDGRAVVESLVKTFGGSFERAVRQWVSAAEIILQYDEAMRNSPNRYLIIKYEDLWNDLEGELRKILTFVGLDDHIYDFERAKNLPVRGSSVFGRNEHEAVNWKPIEKDADFNPLERWAHWDRSQHERFNWIAGKSMKKFGYPEVRLETQQQIWTIWNHLLDLKCQVGEAISFITSVAKPISKLRSATKGTRVKLESSTPPGPLHE